MGEIRIKLKSCLDNPKTGSFILLVVKGWTSSGNMKAKFEGEKPANIVGQVHTHPVDSVSYPVGGDIGFANVNRVPVYTISTEGIFKHLPFTPEKDYTKEAGSDWLSNFGKGTECYSKCE